MGVVRNQMGSEGLAAVIAYLPTQYAQRMLGSKSARAAYVNTLLKSTQRPFIWEYFRPGTIEIPRGEETYFNQVTSPLTRPTKHTDTRCIETSGSLSVESRPACLLKIFQIVWNSDASPT